MNQPELEDRLSRLLKPVYLKHYSHAVHQRQYEESQGLQNPEDTRLEALCKAASRDLLTGLGMEPNFKFQPDFQLLVQCHVIGDPENIKANFLISK